MRGRWSRKEGGLSYARVVLIRRVCMLYVRVFLLPLSSFFGSDRKVGEAGDQVRPLVDARGSPPSPPLQGILHFGFQSVVASCWMLSVIPKYLYKGVISFRPTPGRLRRGGSTGPLSVEVAPPRPKIFWGRGNTDARADPLGNGGC